MKIDFNNYFVDTNILVYYTFPELGFYNESEEIIQKLIDKEKIGCLSKQIFNEYFNITTNTSIITKPLSREQSCKNIEYFNEIFNLLPEFNAYDKIIELIRKYNIKGKRIFNLNMYYCMISNGIERIITANEKDFKTFKGISIYNPYK